MSNANSWAGHILGGGTPERMSDVMAASRFSEARAHGTLSMDVDCIREWRDADKRIFRWTDTPDVRMNVVFVCLGRRSWFEVHLQV